MTPIQRAMCDECAAMMREFYKDPENERKFQEWKRSRKRVCASQPASRKTRTATVHFRTETSVTPEQRRERLQAVFAALFVCACIAATWALEATVWPR